jgi:D-alanyl-D-alanine carboxypeptidase
MQKPRILIDRRRMLLMGAAAAGWATAIGERAAARTPGTDTDLEKRIYEIIRIRRGYLKNPSVSTTVRFANDTELSVVDGLAHPDTGEPVTPATRFMSGSTGKTFCAATVMRLVEEGSLSTNTTIRSLFGGQSWYDSLPNSEDLTIEHLLLHQAGFRQFTELSSFRNSYLSDALRGRPRAYPPRRMLGFISGKPGLFPAGQGYNYSDLNYHLLGLAIEHLTGKDYYGALATLVLDRMSSHRDDVLPANTVYLEGLAAGYARGDLIGRLSGINGRSTDEDGALRNDPSLEYTGGGLALTPRALARFYADLAEGRIVSEKTFSVMLNAAKLGAQPSSGAPYGFGFYVTERERLGRYISHSGFYPGYTSNVGYFLDHGFSVAVQQGSDHGPDLFSMLRQIAEVVISSNRHKED